jgi:hypothetical protein
LVRRLKFPAILIINHQLLRNSGIALALSRSVFIF